MAGLEPATLWVDVVPLAFAGSYVAKGQDGLPDPVPATRGEGNPDGLAHARERVPDGESNPMGRPLEAAVVPFGIRRAVLFCQSMIVSLVRVPATRVEERSTPSGQPFQAMYVPPAFAGRDRVGGTR
jgi:hypothetical protein